MDKAKYKLIKQALIIYTETPQENKHSYLKSFKIDHPDLIEQLIQIIECDQVNQFSLFETPVLDNNFTLDPNDQLDGYTIIRKIGSGGMSNVYEVEQAFPAKRSLAIKVIKQHANQQKLIDETELLASLNHPNVATLHEIGQTKENSLYIVMELINDDDIVTYAERHQLNQSQKLKLFNQLCDGVSHAHEKGIIHCDIKPSNVLIQVIDGNPIVKVIDFGISQFTVNTHLKQAVSGTPAYLSPESKNDANFKLDTRHDVFAMGVLLHRLIYGSMPENKSKNVNLAKDLSSVIQKAISKNRQDRYASPLQLKEDLIRYSAHLPVSSREHSILYIVTKYLRRNFIVASLVLAMLGISITGYYAQFIQANSAKVAQQQAEEISGFLVDLFNTANPETSVDEKISADHLVNQAKDKLLNLKDPTLSEANFMHTLASIFTRMDDISSAAQLIKKSLEVKKNYLDLFEPEYVGGLIQLGLIQRKMDQPKKAESSLKEAIRLIQLQNQPDLSQLAYAHNHLGNLFWKLKENQSSIIHHKLAVKLRLETGEKKLLGDSYNNLGVQYRFNKEWAISSNYFKKALEIYRKELGETHPYVYYVKSNMSYIEEHRFNWGLTEKLLEETVEGFLITYGRGHSNTLLAQANLAKFHTRQLNLDAAIKLWQEIILDASEFNKTKDHAYGLSFLAMIFAQTNNHELSQKTHLDSIKVAEKLGENNNVLPVVYYQYAMSLIEARQYEQAESLIQTSLKLYQHKAPGYHLRLFVKNLEADIFYLTEHYHNAIKAYQHVLINKDESNTQNKIEHIKATLGIGMAYQKIKDYEKSMANYQSALSANQTIYGEQHALNAKILFNMGLLKLEQQQTTQAKSYLNEALLMQNKVLPPKHESIKLTEQTLYTIQQLPPLLNKY